MPARDIFHEHVKQALINDGWMITHDPLRMEIGLKDLYVDLGAERLLAAQKEQEKIAVEVKSFISKSDVQDLKDAVGQYIVYRGILEELEPQRVLYLAVHRKIFKELFEEPIGQITLAKNHIRLIVFDPDKAEIVQWIN